MGVEEQNASNMRAAMEDFAGKDIALRAIKAVMLNMKAFHTKITLKEYFAQKNREFFIGH
jgi:hypothetical protein